MVEDELLVVGIGECGELWGLDLVGGGIYNLVVVIVVVGEWECVLFVGVVVVVGVVGVVFEE